MGVRWAGAIAVAVIGSAFSAPAVRAADPGEQIAALEKIKRSLSPAERKLDSRLAVDLRTKQVTTVDVDIHVSKPDAGLVERLLELGANVRHVSSRSGAIRATVSSSAIRAIARWGEVD